MAQQWNADGNYWFDDTQFGAGGAPVKSQFDTWLGTVSGNAPMQGKVKNYLSGLQTNYGLTTNDFDNALKSYGATYSDGGFLNDKNVGWWGEDAMLRAFGTGLDTLNPNAAYKGSWQSMYDQNAENRQQKDFADRFAANEANQGSDFSDLGDILKGVGLVTGIGGLAGAFGAGAGLTGGGGADLAAAFGDTGLGYGAGSASMGGAAGSGLAGVADAVGYLPNTAEGWVSPSMGGEGGVAVDPGASTFTGTPSSTGGNMDWLDELINQTGTGTGTPTSGDPLSGLFGDQTGGFNTGGSDWATNGFNADGSINTSVMNAGSNAAGTSTNWLSQIAKAPASILKSLGLSDSDISTIGKLGAAGLGAYASNQQSNALAEQAAKFAEFGAPYRQQLASLQSDPGSFLSSPRVTSAVDQGTSAMARALSARDGNPTGSGRALQEMQNYATNSLYGQLTNRENQLANFGGLSNFDAAAPSANLASVQQTGNMYNAIGAGINDIFNPQPTYLDLIKAVKGLA